MRTAVFFLYLCVVGDCFCESGRPYSYLLQYNNWENWSLGKELNTAFRQISDLEPAPHIKSKMLNWSQVSIEESFQYF